MLSSKSSRKQPLYEKICNFLWKTLFAQCFHWFYYMFSTAFPMSFTQNHFPQGSPHEVIKIFPKVFHKIAFLTENDGISIRFQSKFCRNLASFCEILRNSPQDSDWKRKYIFSKMTKKQGKIRSRRSKFKTVFSLRKRWMKGLMRDGMKKSVFLKNESFRINICGIMIENTGFQGKRKQKNIPRTDLFTGRIHAGREALRS